jgi:group I intron endonuclease
MKNFGQSAGKYAHTTQVTKKNIHKAELHNLIWYSLNEEGQILDFTLTETPCIYMFRLLPHPKHAYVGSTNNLYRRFMYHRSDFSRGKKTCPLFYQAIREHAWQQFEFAILEHVLVEAQLLQREQYYLDTLLPHFNLNRLVWVEKGNLRFPQDALIDRRRYAYRLSDKTKAKISAARQAQMRHPSYEIIREKMRQSRLGKTKHCLPKLEKRSDKLD